MRQRWNSEEGSGKGFIYGDFFEGDRDGLGFAVGDRSKSDDFFGKTHRVDAHLAFFADGAAGFSFGQSQAARGELKVAREGNIGRVDKGDFLTGDSLDGDRTLIFNPRTLLPVRSVAALHALAAGAQWPETFIAARKVGALQIQAACTR